MKLIGKLQDGTVFFKKGHDGDEEPFEFQTDEGTKLYLGLEMCSIWYVNTCFLHSCIMWEQNKF